MGKGKNKHKRRSNTSLQTRRAKSWLNGERRKDRLRKLQDERHRDNVKSGTSPWKEARAERRRKRLPLAEAWRRRQKDDVLSAS